MKIERGNFKVVCACCMSGNCVRCLACHELTRRRARVVLDRLSENCANAVAANWRDYGSRVVPDDEPVKQFIGEYQRKK